MKENASHFGDRMLVKEEELFDQFIGEIKEYAIFIMDTEGHICSWNKGARHIKNYAPDEVIGQHYRMLFPADKRESNFPEMELDYAKKNGRFEDESWRMRKSGELFWANVVLTAIYNEKGEVKYLVKITKDLTERKKVEDELYRQNEKLVRVNADLDNFVYTASHDLKSPVLNMQSLLEILEKEKDPAKISQMLAFMKKSLNKLQETLHELGDIGRIQKDLEDGQEEVIDLPGLFEDIKYSVSNEMDQDCIHIDTDFQLEKLRFSKMNLKSILLNLLTNAMKYRSPDRDCHIKVSAYQAQEHVVLEVKDNGIGIAAGQEEKIFKMFTRLSSKVEGSGVGLYIVKRIVDKAGGQILIDSQEGKGSTFKILLPGKIAY